MTKTLFLKDSVLFISIDGKEYEVSNPKVFEDMYIPLGVTYNEFFLFHNGGYGCEWPYGVELIELEILPPILKARLLPKEKKEPFVELSEPQEKEPTVYQKRKAIEKRAVWLKYCLDIGWTKDQIDGLEKIWDQHHDEFGNLIKGVPAPIESQEELWREVLAKYLNSPMRHQDWKKWAQKHFSITRLTP